MNTKYEIDSIHRKELSPPPNIKNTHRFLFVRTTQPTQQRNVVRRNG